MLMERYATNKQANLCGCGQRLACGGSQCRDSSGLEPAGQGGDAQRHEGRYQHGQITLGQWGLSSLVGCLTFRQQASVSQGRICTDKFTCCHTEIEVANQTFYFTKSPYTNTGPTSPNAWQRSHGVPVLKVDGMTRTGKIPTVRAGIEPRICRSRGGRLNH